MFSFYARMRTTYVSSRYDEKNLTPSDYTVFIEVNRDQSEIFDEVYYDKN